MGKIKSSAIKKTTKKLLKDNQEIFATNFEKNKEIVLKMIKADKSVQNKLAGYITKLKKQMQKKT